MPFDGSGNFNRVMNWVSDAAAAIKIVATRHDQEDDNFASGLSNTLTKDGQSQPTANIPMNGKRLINLGTPVNPADAATKAYTDGIRNFSTAITLTGNVPEARIGFTVADLGFGVRVAGTPVDSLNRFVWNTEPDLSGTDVMVLDDTGKLVLTGPISMAGFFTFTGTGNGFGYTEIDMSWRAKTAPNRMVVNDKLDGTGADVVSLTETGAVTFADRLRLSGLEAAGVSKAFVSFAEINRSLVARKAGTPVGSLARVVLNDNADGTGPNDLFDFDQALQKNKDGTIVDAGYVQTPRTTPDAVAVNTYTPAPAGANLRQVNAVAVPWTFNAPVAAGNYSMVVLINNVVASGAVTFAGFNKVTGGTHPTAIGKMSLVYITKVGAAKTAFVEVLP